MTDKKDMSEMTNEEIAKETWVELRERYGNLGSTWDQLTDTLSVVECFGTG